MCLGVQLLRGDPGFPSDSQGHSYLMLYIPPLYITSWATSSFNILGGLYFFMGKLLYISIFKK